MAATGLYRYYEGLPTIAKAIVIIAFVILIFVLILWIRKLLKDAEEKNKQKERDQEYIKDFQKYCQGKANIGQSSYPATSFIQMASTIFEAGCAEDYITCGGTDEEAIKSVFEQMNTTCDVIQLVQAFGKRRARTLDINTGLIALNPFSSSDEYPTYELGAWLKKELDAQDIQEYVNGILQSKGINYRF